MSKKDGIGNAGPVLLFYEMLAVRKSGKWKVCFGHRAE
jgi:hypothetical protein